MGLGEQFVLSTLSRDAAQVPFQHEHVCVFLTNVCVPESMQCYSLLLEAELSSWHYRVHFVPPLVLVSLDRFSMYLWLPSLF